MIKKKKKGTSSNPDKKLPTEFTNFTIFYLSSKISRESMNGQRGRNKYGLTIMNSGLAKIGYKVQYFTGKL